MSKRVLIAPLHWGLGHATRCVPLIEDQLNQGNEVLLAAEHGPRAFLEAIFPKVNFIEIPFMTITYPRDGNMSQHFFKLGPALIRSIWKEHKLLQRAVQAHNIDLVISDSRFGLWTRSAKCVFITHQVQIFSPHFKGIINALNRWIMSKYDEVWIPDYKQAPGLAGVLSHPAHIPSNAKYIGPLSRFKTPKAQKKTRWKAVVMVSGPEPQRSLFEADMARRFIESDEPALILQGKPDVPNRTEIGNLVIVNHLPDQDLVDALTSAELVIARSGYSTIMDLNLLGIDAEYHPTPGQTEQEYLAELHALQDKTRLEK